jgi:hypothetical protein
LDANYTAIIVPIVVALVAASPGILALWRQAKVDEKNQPQLDINEGIQASKDASEVIKQYSEEMRQIRKELRDTNAEIAILRGKVAEQDVLISEWKIGISRLIAQLISLGHNPVWEPKTRPLKAEGE